MAIELVELADSRRFVNGTVTFHYRITGTDDDVTAYTYLITHIPAYYEGLSLQADGVSVEPQWADEVTNDGRWDCLVRYGKYASSEESESDIGTVRIAGDISGDSVHITQSLSTTKYPSGAKDYSGAIGVTLDGTVEGVDIAVPIFHFTVTKVWASLPSIDEIYSLATKVNSSSFSVTDTVQSKTLTFAAGECLFHGAQWGTERPDGGIEVVYSFSAIPNKSSFSLGGISVSSKKGWEYLWVDYERQEGTGDDADRMLTVPIAVYVEKVFDEANLNLLGI